MHLLVHAGDRLEVSAFMREVAGEFAWAYARRKERTNASWGDNFHAPLVEKGSYVWRCLCDIELNMARGGVVSHPREWDWIGYHEIIGHRQRYRVLDLERLCWRCRTDALGAVQKNLEASLAEALAREEARREPCWTEGLAVGSARFAAEVKPLNLFRQ